MLTIPLAGLHPSQLYISADKLARVQAFPHLEPVPILRLDGRIILTDGHTRAVAALLAGQAALPVVWDSDELDLDAYRICVQWCQDEGVTSIRALSSRILTAADYQVRWLDRCRTMQQQLEARRANKS